MVGTARPAATVAAMRLLSAAHRPLRLSGTNRRAQRLPDLRHLVVPRLSAAPLPGEVDFDDLIVHRAWRSYEPDRPNEVRYFLYELSQRNPGEDDYHTFYKAVRFIRLTRVPRYLRQLSASGQGGPGLVFEQMRDVLAALREQEVLFVNLIAKSPDMPLVFAYGVQAVGQTPEEAARIADESYEILAGQLDGTYQQLEYRPINFDEGERLARYQAEWDHIAMARGRPLPLGQSVGPVGLLDGNRTDVESSNNQLESFIRGMVDSNQRGFMLSLVTVPVPVDQLSLAWRNVTERLSEVRSDQDGSRTLNAGVALPFTTGFAAGDGHGSAHTAGTQTQAGQAQGVARTETVGTTHSHALGSSASVADSVSQAHTVGASHAVSHGVTDTVSAAQSHTEGRSIADGHSLSITHGQSVGASLTEGVARTAGESFGVTHGQSLSHTVGVSQSQSLANGVTSSENWSQGSSLAHGATASRADSLQHSFAETLQQTLGITNTVGDSATSGHGASSGSGVHGGIFGFGGSGQEESNTNFSRQLSSANALANSLAGGGSRGVSLGSTRTEGISETVTQSAQVGGAFGHSLVATNTVGRNEAIAAGESVAATQASSLAQTQSLSRATMVGHSLADTAGVNRTIGANAAASTQAGLSRGVSAAETVGSSVAETTGTSRTVAQGVNHTETLGTSRSSADATSASASQAQGLTDAWMVSASRQVQQMGSLAAVPSFGIAISRATHDAAKRVLGDILEAQQRRYMEGVESGAFLYQMFLVAEDRPTLLRAAGLLKAAFWGPGSADKRVVEPFHVVTSFDPEEAQRLLVHARAFTSYRKREPNVELIQPFLYSSYVTPSEASAFCHPPTVEAPGLLAVHDSMPVFALPADRDRRELTLGRLVNGERARVDERRFGLDVDELTHVLVSGFTGSGKTTTLLRLLSELVRFEREIVVPTPTPTRRRVPASILGFDWMPNMRDLASVTDPVVRHADGSVTGRFQFFSVARRDLGAFRWNPLAVPHDALDPRDWLNAQADNFTAAMGLGEFGRSIIAELLDTLYRANRLGDTVLVPARVDADGNVLRPALVLPAIDAATLPPDAVRTDGAGFAFANVYTLPALSRLVGMEHLAALCLARMEEAATVEGGRLYGSAMRDRLQSLWRRLSYFAPGGLMADLCVADARLDEPRALTIGDLVDPDRGLVTVVETEGLDIPNRRLILGSVLLALYKTGLVLGEGAFNHRGQGPGLFVVLEEAHELFREEDKGEDRFSAGTRTVLYEELHRRVRALGARFVDVVQNPGAVPSAITSNIGTVFVHRTYDKADRERICSLMNWNNQLGQNQREYRYLGEMPEGYCLARLHAKHHFLESAPVLFRTDPAALARVTDAQLTELARRRA